jgi:hypothetical protein
VPFSNSSKLIAVRQTDSSDAFILQKSAGGANL